MKKFLSRFSTIPFSLNLSDRSLYLIIIAGITVRILIVILSQGTNDIYYWQSHATLIDAKGLIGAYKTPGSFNHPPLPALYAHWAYYFVDGNLLTFSRLIKLPGLFAEILIIWTLFRYYSLRLSALYAILPAGILISSFHGNTDCLYAAFLLISTIHFTKNKYFLSGLFFALALNVKLVPLVLLPAFLISCLSRKSFLNFSLGGITGMLPYYYPAMIAPFDMYRNMLAYNSNQDYWGFQLFFNKLRESTSYDGLADTFSFFYSKIGRYIILIGTISFATHSRLKEKIDFKTLVSLCGLWFFFTTPGFGVQYVVFILPVLLISNEEWGNFWGLWSGIFIGSVYYIFKINWYPFESHFGSFYPKYTKLIGLIPWIFALKISVSHLKRLITKSNLA